PDPSPATDVYPDRPRAAQHRGDIVPGVPERNRSSLKYLAGRSTHEARSGKDHRSTVTPDLGRGSALKRAQSIPYLRTLYEMIRSVVPSRRAALARFPRLVLRASRIRSFS